MMALRGTTEAEEEGCLLQSIYTAWQNTQKSRRVGGEACIAVLLFVESFKHLKRSLLKMVGPLPGHEPTPNSFQKEFKRLSERE